MKNVPIAFWGKDHWSTLAYAETCAVDHQGLLNKEHMRCDVRIHPAQANQCNSPDFGSPKRYPTQLSGGKVRLKHDDWSCLEDAEAEGLLVMEGTGVYPVVRFTSKGHRVLGELREWKARGGTFSNYQPTPEVLVA